MRIGLVDVDGHNFPNLALMKISAWYKAQGHEVSFANPLEEYDKIYQSKVFTFTPDIPYTWKCEIEKGGTGYGDYSKVLPDCIEHTCPDYSLYGDEGTAYGFTTRGCIRNCPFCLVHRKEGNIRPNAEVGEFLCGKKKVVLMDNNILAHRHGVSQLEKLKELGVATDINQGLDARIMCKSDYICNLIADLKPYGSRCIRIACDQDEEIEPCHIVIRKITERNPKARIMVFCILTDDKDNSIKRVSEWRRYGHSVAVYAPPFRDYTRGGADTQMAKGCWPVGHKQMALLQGRA